MPQPPSWDAMTPAQQRAYIQGVVPRAAWAGRLCSVCGNDVGPHGCMACGASLELLLERPMIADLSIDGFLGRQPYSCTQCGGPVPERLPTTLPARTRAQAWEQAVAAMQRDVCNACLHRRHVDLPLVAGVVIAYRGWYLQDLESLQLEGQGGFVWPVRQRAEGLCEFGHQVPCTAEEAAAEHWAHGCGLYATNEMQFGSWGSVYGKVALWGRIAEHEEGYRAQYGYPVEFYYDDEHNGQGHPREIVGKVAKLYGVPAFPLREVV